MAYTSSAIELAFNATGVLGKIQPKVQPKIQPKAQPKRGLFGRLLDSMMAARTRQAEREVTRYLAETGGKFTDEVEREIERRFLANSHR